MKENETQVAYLNPSALIKDVKESSWSTQETVLLFFAELLHIFNDRVYGELVDEFADRYTAVRRADGRKRRALIGPCIDAMSAESEDLFAHDPAMFREFARNLAPQIKK